MSGTTTQSEVKPSSTSDEALVDSAAISRTLNQHGRAIGHLQTLSANGALLSSLPARQMGTKEKILFGIITAAVIFSFVTLYQNIGLRAQVTDMQKSVEVIKANTTWTPVKTWGVWPWNWF